MPRSTLNVNGKDVAVSAPSEESLLSVLRNRLHLTGTKYGCGEGQCGACTVLLDGQAVRSCRTSFAEAQGRQVVTVEGLERDGKLHPVQQAFLDQEAFQCAYCTSGMIMQSVGLLRVNPSPTEEEIIRSMKGNICRCGTYSRILAAVRRAAHGEKA